MIEPRLKYLVLSATFRRGQLLTGVYPEKCDEGEGGEWP